MSLASAKTLPASERGEAACYHCGLPVSRGRNLTLVIDGAERALCCHGCLAVAKAIVDGGHENFYRVRTEAAPTGCELLPEFIRESRGYDDDAIQQQYVQRSDGESREISLILEGITCAACIWLIEHTIAALPGVEQVRVNYATQRALVNWNAGRIRLSEILQAIHRVGYRALPYDPRRQQDSRQRERRAQLRRLLIAGLFGMQVMMLSISLYAGASSGIDAEFDRLFRWLCLLLTLPVLGYAGFPFFAAAWRDLRRRRASMDLPVSLALGIAFASSALATIRDSGEIYFDSVVMFVFFLSASRYLETMARQRCAGQVEKLVQSLPQMAHRISGADTETVAAASLRVGDRILVRPGETVPADAEIETGESRFDESLISGESQALPRGPRARVLGGSINRENPVRLRVTAVGAATVLAEIQRMMERAQADKPPIAQLADRIASVFILVVLAIVAAVAGYWWLQQDPQWFEIALAVLIVSCPCALSLATPAALSASLGRLQGSGMLVKHSGALEALTRVSHVVFDKTGTLTEGRPLLQDILYAEGADRARCRDLAAALECHSEHPLARALCAALDGAAGIEASELVNRPGGGLAGTIDNRRYWIGHADFVAAEAGVHLPPAWIERARAGTAVVLADARSGLALFGFDDGLRESSRELVRWLRAAGKHVVLMSGDHSAAVERVARQCGIGNFRGGLSPAQKIDSVRALQAGGARVLMIGDGVNDAPVLAGADVSIAVGSATALAKTSADIVLLGNRLDAVAEVIERADKTQRVIRQNLGWALVYNLGAIPAAAMGLVAPWLAALGMSLSSLLVVINAMRLTR